MLRGKLSVTVAVASQQYVLAFTGLPQSPVVEAGSVGRDGLSCRNSLSNTLKQPSAATLNLTRRTQPRAPALCLVVAAERLQVPQEHGGRAYMIQCHTNGSGPYPTCA